MCLLEYTALDGSVLDTPEGRVVVPGHAIESMWFQMHIFEHRGETERIAQAIECVRWHTETAWDPEWGGLVLAFDSEWEGEPAWEHAMKKFWWVHTETLYALLLSYYHSREQWCPRLARPRDGVDLRPLPTPRAWRVDDAADTRGQAPGGAASLIRCRSRTRSTRRAHS
jgi:mannose/cellobiose epimerase-like protein (N-acyl-D-glucosamine 2-epimerase family)